LRQVEKRVAGEKDRAQQQKAARLAAGGFAHPTVMNFL
jgi:hypothetical protein